MTDDPNISAPLAAFEGRSPTRPAWFDKALAQPPQREWHEAQGARIETLRWGDPSKPGLVLLHGNKAHADWWSFIAPFLADQFHVVAPSWSGMGGSDWRERYDLDVYVNELDAVLQSTGLYDGPHKPLVVAHSFGGFVAARFAAERGEKLGGIVTIDVPLKKRDKDEPHSRREIEQARNPRPHRVYPTLEAALARFRFAPPQPCENLFIADFLARSSLKRAPLEGQAEEGWTWRFDPALWRDMRITNPWVDVAHSRCRVAVMWGGDSSLIQADLLAKARTAAGAKTPFIEIPAAQHHVMVDQPLALVGALRGLLAAWPPKRS